MHFTETDELRLRRWLGKEVEKELDIGDQSEVMLNYIIGLLKSNSALGLEAGQLEGNPLHVCVKAALTEKLKCFFKSGVESFVKRLLKRVNLVYDNNSDRSPPAPPPLISLQEQTVPQRNEDPIIAQEPVDVFYDSWRPLQSMDNTHGIGADLWEITNADISAPGAPEFNGSLGVMYKSFSDVGAFDGIRRTESTTSSHVFSQPTPKLEAKLGNAASSLPPKFFPPAPPLPCKQLGPSQQLSYQVPLPMAPPNAPMYDPALFPGPPPSWIHANSYFFPSLPPFKSQTPLVLPYLTRPPPAPQFTTTTAHMMRPVRISCPKRPEPPLLLGLPPLAFPAQSFNQAGGHSMGSSMPVAGTLSLENEAASSQPTASTAQNVAPVPSLASKEPSTTPLEIVWNFEEKRDRLMELNRGRAEMFAQLDREHREMLRKVEKAKLCGDEKSLSVYREKAAAFEKEKNYTKWELKRLEGYMEALEKAHLARLGAAEQTSNGRGRKNGD